MSFKRKLYEEILKYDVATDFVMRIKLMRIKLMRTKPFPPQCLQV